MYPKRAGATATLRGYAQLCAAPDFEEVFTGQTLFLRGADSDYVRPEHETILKQWFTESHLVSLAAAGHWLHVDQPEAFSDRVRCHLRG